MYNIPKKFRAKDLIINDSVEGESIEIMIERLINNNDEERIENKEVLYTRPEDGIIAHFNIKYDWWDDGAENASIMAEKASELSAAQLKKRKELLEKKKEEENFLKEHAQEQLKVKKAGDNPPAGE